MEGVSIVIPTYFRNKCLGQAIKSVHDTDFSPIEIIVVDDSGERHAETVIKDYRNIRYIPLEENRGPQVARTIGVNNANGKYIQMLDDDDQIKNGKFTNQTRLLESNPETGVAYCGVEWVDAENVWPKPDMKGDVLPHTLAFDASPCVTSTMFIKSNILKELLPFRDLPAADDIDLKIRLAKRTKFDYVNELLVKRRRIDKSRGDIRSRAAIEGRKQLMKDYEYLYDQSSAKVRNTALSEIYKREGLYYLSQNTWSANAIISLILCNYFSPDISYNKLGMLFLSLFGRSGLNLGKKVKGLQPVFQ